MVVYLHNINIITYIHVVLIPIQKIKDFQLLKVIGKGSFAKVSSLIIVESTSVPMKKLELETNSAWLVWSLDMTQSCMIFSVQAEYAHSKSDVSYYNIIIIIGF